MTSNSLWEIHAENSSAHFMTFIASGYSKKKCETIAHLVPFSSMVYEDLHIRTGDFPVVKSPEVSRQFAQRSEQPHWKWNSLKSAVTICSYIFLLTFYGSILRRTKVVFQI